MHRGSLRCKYKDKQHEMGQNRPVRFNGNLNGASADGNHRGWENLITDEARLGWAWILMV
ncbi:hypothetical protein N7456_010420 [Penicillium angulare]|uniref:Uncharacterized protein n=1 Tax=Penicillium angulare TaxID=116970 RepID=A0A9W9K664_9EURO|nr:hypothetical protein N7456_010420 [Penicillium angulare]